MGRLKRPLIGSHWSRDLITGLSLAQEFLSYFSRFILKSLFSSESVTAYYRQKLAQLEAKAAAEAQVILSSDWSIFLILASHWSVELRELHPG